MVALFGGSRYNYYNNNNHVKMDAIPAELTVKILSYLSPYSDFNSARLVCRKWYRVVKTIIKALQREFRHAVLNGDLLYTIEDRTISVPKTHRPSHERGYINIRSNRRLQIRDGAEPNPRFSHNCCVIGRRLYIFGGCALSNSSANAAFNDLHGFDLIDKKWERLTIDQGYLPAPRECSSMVAYENKLIIFGGWNSPRSTEVTGLPKFFNDTSVVDVINRSCTRATYSEKEAPSARAGHSACIYKDKMVIFGGAQRLLRYDDVWLLDLQDFQWSCPQIQGKKPEGRFGQSQFLVGDDQILIIGGCGGSNTLFDDIWLLSCNSWSWTEIKILNKIWQPPDLWCHPMVKIGTLLVTFSDQNVCNGCIGFQGNPLESSLFAVPVPVPSIICAKCGQNKVKRQNFDSRFQMYVLDLTGLEETRTATWVDKPSFIPQAISRSRSLFSAAIGRAEVLLFGGVFNMERMKINKSPPSGLVIVRAK